MINRPIKTRFAPSPTGYLHLGNIRTALFSALFAHKHNNHFVLRIEDTDQERSKSEFVTALKQDLSWLNITWQEGPDVGGEVGPYFQSERNHIYNNYYQTLEKNNQAYPCFCSERQLTLSKKAQLSAGKAPKYAGTCRSLNHDEIKQKIERGEQPTLRFNVPLKEIVSFNDFVKGKQSFSTQDIGDFIIRRANGTPSFMFSNAIDDALMGITHVMRGDDHLTNTPRQLLILSALGLPQPEYGHISLILGEKDSPLSKRSGSLDIQTLREANFFPKAILNYIARLGHYYRDNQLMTYEELAQHFELENLNTSAARFDYNQLLYWQKETMSAASADYLVNFLPETCKQRIPKADLTAFLDAIKNNMTFISEIPHWIDIVYTETLTLSPEAKDILEKTSPDFFKHAYQAFLENQCEYQAAMNQLKETSGQKGKSLFMPIRVAITGQEHGPEMQNLFKLIHNDFILKRLTDAEQFSQK